MAEKERALREVGKGQGLGTSDVQYIGNNRLDTPVCYVSKFRQSINKKVPSLTHGLASVVRVYCAYVIVSTGKKEGEKCYEHQYHTKHKIRASTASEKRGLLGYSGQSAVELVNFGVGRRRYSTRVSKAPGVSLIRAQG